MEDQTQSGQQQFEGLATAVSTQHSAPTPATTTTVAMTQQEQAEEQRRQLRAALIEALQQTDDAAAIALIQQRGLEQLAPTPIPGDDRGFSQRSWRDHPPLHLAVGFGREAVYDALLAAGKSLHASRAAGAAPGGTRKPACCTVLLVLVPPPPAPHRLQSHATYRSTNHLSSPHQAPTHWSWHPADTTCCTYAKSLPCYRASWPPASTWRAATATATRRCLPPRPSTRAAPSSRTSSTSAPTLPQQTGGGAPRCTWWRGRPQTSV